MTWSSLDCNNNHTLSSDKPLHSCCCFDALSSEISNTITPHSSMSEQHQSCSKNSKSYSAASAAKSLKFGIDKILAQSPKATTTGNNNNNDKTSRIFPRHQSKSDTTTDSQLVSIVPISSNAYSFWKPLMLMQSRFGANFDKSQVRRVGHPYQARAPAKHKKPRTAFTRGQVRQLEDRFGQQKYLASAERQKLAEQLNMSDSQVKTWFQNRRTKWRRQTAEEREQERQSAAKYLGLRGADQSVYQSSTLCIRPDVTI